MILELWVHEIKKNVFLIPNIAITAILFFN